MIIRLKPQIIRPKWLIEGHPDYFFAENKKLYRVSTQREIRLILMGYTKGYYLNRKFFSLKQLKSLIYKIDVEQVERTPNISK